MKYHRTPLPLSLLCYPDGSVYYAAQGGPTLTAIPQPLRCWDYGRSHQAWAGPLLSTLHELCLLQSHPTAAMYKPRTTVIVTNPQTCVTDENQGSGYRKRAHSDFPGLLRVCAFHFPPDRTLRHWSLHANPSQSESLLLLEESVDMTSTSSSFSLLCPGGSSRKSVL